MMLFLFKHLIRVFFVYLSVQFTLGYEIVSVDMPMLIESRYMLSQPNDKSLINPNEKYVNIDSHYSTASIQLRPSFDIWKFFVSANLWLYSTSNFSDYSLKNYRWSEAMVETHPLSSMGLYGGLKRPQWGSGYFWNPSNPLADREQNNSDRAFSYRIKPYWNAGFENSFENYSHSYFWYWEDKEELALRKTVKNHQFISRQTYFFSSAEITGIFGLINNESFLASTLSSTLSKRMEVHGEAAYYYQKEKISITSNNAPEPYNIYQLSDSNKQHVLQFLLGSQYTLGAQTNLLLEYYYNQLGFSTSEMNRLFAAAKSSHKNSQDPIAGEAHIGFLRTANYLPGFLRQHYFSFRLAQPNLFKNFDLNVTARFALEEWGDFLLGTYINVPFHQAANLKASFEYYNMDSLGESGLIPFEHQINLSLQIFL